MKTKKSKLLCYILAFFLGAFGAHLFYLKKNKKGWLYLAFFWTYIPMILGWIDMLFINKWFKELEMQDANYGEHIKEEKVRAIEFDAKSENSNTNKILNKNLSKNDGNSYSYENLILPKYAHLKTPAFILKSIKELRNGKKTVKTKEVTIEITYGNNNINFGRDSLKYSNEKGDKCSYKPLFEYWTKFESLDSEQRKWYFYWRTQVLQGNYLDTDLSYIILFTYELINYTFNQNAALNVSMLVNLYENYKDREPKLKNYLPQWIGDFLLELGEETLAKDFIDSIWEDEKELFNKVYKSKNNLEELPIATWKPFINQYRETEFFKNNRQKVYKVFKKSTQVLKDAYEREGKDILDLWFSREEKYKDKPLYQSAVIARELGKVQMRTMNYHANKKIFDDMTGLIRLSENIVREMNGEKRLLKVDEESFPNNFKEQLVNKLNFVKPRNEEKTIKEVNNNFEKMNSRFKLVQQAVDNGSSENITIPKNVDEAEVVENTNRINFDVNRIKELNEENEQLQKVFREKGYEDEVKENESSFKNEIEEIAVELKKEKQVNLTQHIFDSVDVNEIEFIKCLSQNEIEFLASFNNRKKSFSETTEFCKEIGIMVGNFISKINEKSNKYLDDNFIELNDNYYEIYEEYEEIIKNIKAGELNEN